jgi:sugar/nucleoside kinase (ribokinase family)
MEKFDVIVSGMVSVDVIFSEIKELPKPSEEIYCEDFEFTCGAMYNTAVALSRLGMKVAILAPIGNDFLSKFILDSLEKEGVVTTYMKHLDQPLRTLSVALNYDGDRSFVSYEDKIKDFDYERYTISMLEKLDASFLHISAEKQAKAVIQAAREKGLKISLDVGWNEKWLKSSELKEIIGLGDLFTPNVKEALEISGKTEPVEALHVLSSFHPNNLIVIKLGEKGAIFKKGDEIIEIPGWKRIPVDTTGAGDVFSAGLLTGMIKNFYLEDAVLLGNFCGGCSVEGLGGTKASPRWSDVPEQFK